MLGKFFGIGEVPVGAPVLLLRDSLVIADLHLGFSLIGKDYPRRVQMKILRNEADAILGMIGDFRGGVREIIILGDIKEPIGFPKKIFREQIGYFFRGIESYFEEIIIIRGNHDGRLADILGEYGIEARIVDQYVKDVEGRKVLLVHGHIRPPQQMFLASDIIMVGHIHPGEVEIREKLWVVVGFQIDIPEVSMTQEKNLIIFPAANPRLIGTDITEDVVVDLIKRLSPVGSIPKINFGIKLSQQLEVVGSL